MRHIWTARRQIANLTVMRISRQTSGGRGEYELAEDYGSIRPTDLYDLPIILDMGEGIVVNTQVALKRSETQGKRRLRLLHERRDIQIPRQVAAALLMPRPVRKRGDLGAGEPVLRRGRYAIEDIEMADVRRSDSDVVMRIKDIVVGNQSHQAEVHNFSNRMREVHKAWENKDKFPAPIPALLDTHQRAVRAGDPIPKATEQLVQQLQDSFVDASAELGITYIGSMDVLPALLEAIGGIVEAPTISVDDIEPEDVEIKRRVAEQWRRWAAARGYKSAKFRREVRDAYSSRCIVCGEQFPPTAFNKKPGVDAAHILPWAQYDLDVVSNGVCLCKTHHWAFDEGLIEIEFENNQYSVVVPDAARIEIGLTPFSLDAIARFAGLIPTDRLPSDRSKWPSADLLRRLREGTSQQA